VVYKINWIEKIKVCCSALFGWNIITDLIDFNLYVLSYLKVFLTIKGIQNLKRLFENYLLGGLLGKVLFCYRYIGFPWVHKFIQDTWIMQQRSFQQKNSDILNSHLLTFVQPQKQFALIWLDSSDVPLSLTSFKIKPVIWGHRASRGECIHRFGWTFPLTLHYVMAAIVAQCRRSCLVRVLLISALFGFMEETYSTEDNPKITAADNCFNGLSFAPHTVLPPRRITVRFVPPQSCVSAYNQRVLPPSLPETHTWRVICSNILMLSHTRGTHTHTHTHTQAPSKVSSGVWMWQAADADGLFHTRTPK